MSLTVSQKQPLDLSILRKKIALVHLTKDFELVVTYRDPDRPNRSSKKKVVFTAERWLKDEVIARIALETP